MASAVNELGQLLRGGEASGEEERQQESGGDGGEETGGAASPAAAAGGEGGPGVDLSKLSQLSDFADKELQRDQKPPQFSQESLIEAQHNPLTFQQASQPADIPAPLLPESQNMSTLPSGATPGSAAEAASVAAAEEQQKQMAAAAAIPNMHELMAMMTPGMLNMDWGALQVSIHSLPACHAFACFSFNKPAKLATTNLTFLLYK